MSAYFSISLLTAASKALLTTTQTDVEQYYNYSHLENLGNYNPDDRSYGFPVYYPSYEHSEEEEYKPEPFV